MGPATDYWDMQFRKDNDMTNLEIRVFSQSIRNFINESTLPTEMKRIALNEIVREVSDQAEAEILAELQEKERKEVGENAESL